MTTLLLNNHGVKMKEFQTIDEELKKLESDSDLSEFDEQKDSNEGIELNTDSEIEDELDLENKEIDLDLNDEVELSKHLNDIENMTRQVWKIDEFSI